MTTGNLRVLNLFCGAGGMALGFKMAGFKVVGGIDTDHWGCRTFQHNFTRALVIEDDIHAIPPESLAPLAPTVIVGGPPCQGFSIEGRVKIASLHGLGVSSRFVDDPRNVLYSEFVRFISILRPVFFLMENVPGLRSHRDGRTLEEIIQGFNTMGYTVSAREINAADLGVPQIRKRLIFIGNRLDTRNPFPAPSHHPEDSLLSPKYISVNQAIGDLPEPRIVTPRKWDGEKGLAFRKKPRNTYQAWARKGVARVFNHVTRKVTPRDLEIFRHLPAGARYRDLPPHLKPYRDDVFSDRLKRLFTDRPSWTVVAHLAKDGYRFIHPTQHRTIAVREAARLQSFPDGFRFLGPFTRQFRQVGNAFPPLMAKAIAEELRKALESLQPQEIHHEKVAGVV